LILEERYKWLLLKEKEEKMSKVVEINQNEFDEKVKGSKKVLVDCYAEWCGPCKMLSPIIDQLAEETDTCEFYKLNVDEAGDVAEKYGIMSIPTLLLFEDGELKDTFVGFRSKEELEEIVK